MLAELFLRYNAVVYGVCLKYLQNHELAKDAVMNIYEQLLQKVAEHTIHNFKSWLHVLAKNHCLMYLRKKQLNIVGTSDDAIMQSFENMHHENNEDAFLLKEQQLQKMEDCIQQLQTEQQKAIRLFFLEEKCYQEIIDVTGFEWNKVRSLLQNGRRNLKICMEKNAA